MHILPLYDFFTDDESDEKLALCLLVPLFAAKRSVNVVMSLYERCLVSCVCVHVYQFVNIIYIQYVKKKNLQFWKIRYLSLNGMRMKVIHERIYFR